MFPHCRAFRDQLAGSEVPRATLGHCEYSYPTKMLRHAQRKQSPIMATRDVISLESGAIIDGNKIRRVEGKENKDKQKKTYIRFGLGPATPNPFPAMGLLLDSGAALGEQAPPVQA